MVQAWLGLCPWGSSLEILAFLSFHYQSIETSYPWSSQFFPLKEYQQVGFQQHRYLLYLSATEITEYFTLGISRRRISPILISFYNLIL